MICEERPLGHEDHGSSLTENSFQKQISGNIFPIWRKKPTELEIHTEPDDGAVRVILTGELDISGEQRLRDVLRAVEAGRPKRVLVDLRSLAFMDSTGLRLLIEAHTRAHAAGCPLDVVHNGGQIRQVFELTGVGKYLSVVEG
jgi:anti-anti-sigma factor